ncbi:MAG: septum formation initiator family protein [Methylococcales bacterium]|jgi:cell division protein FtsB|nr:cell division protein FtsB [Methylococcaceae bacterium]
MNVFKILAVILFLLIIQLQYRLWFGDGNVQQVKVYQQRLDTLKIEVRLKQERNEKLYAEVLDLRKGEAAIEERARYELGMIKHNETYFQVIE